MAAIKSTKVPRAFGETYAVITTITDIFCRERLNEEYGELARFATAEVGEIVAVAGSVKEDSVQFACRLRRQKGPTQTTQPGRSFVFPAQILMCASLIGAL